MTRPSGVQVAVFGALLASLAFNCLQGTRILKLEQVLDAASPSERPAEGMVLPSLELKGKDGTYSRRRASGANAMELTFVLCHNILEAILD